MESMRAPKTTNVQIAGRKWIETLWLIANRLGTGCVNVLERDLTSEKCLLQSLLFIRCEARWESHACAAVRCASAFWVSYWEREGLG